MARTWIIACAACASLGSGPMPSHPQPDQPTAAPQPAPTVDLARKFLELGLAFTARENQFSHDLRKANALRHDDTAFNNRISELNEQFDREWFALIVQTRALIRRHPTDPATLEGLIILTGTMRSYLDDQDVQIVQKRFLDDPRIIRLCQAIEYGYDESTRSIHDHVSKHHPDSQVRAQALYYLARHWRFVAENLRQKAIPETTEDRALARARDLFTQVVSQSADVRAPDGSFSLREHAAAEIARIDNLPNLKIGRPAPEIAANDLSGKLLRLSDHRGKVVVLVFWATWCGPCMAQVPHERTLANRLAGMPFQLLGVNCDEAADREKVLLTVQEKQMHWPHWWDGEHRGPIQTANDVPHWPRVFVIDPQGIIRHIDLHGPELDAAVDALLAEFVPAP